MWWGKNLKSAQSTLLGFTAVSRRIESGKRIPGSSRLIHLHSSACCLPIWPGRTPEIINTREISAPQNPSNSIAVDCGANRMGDPVVESAENAEVRILMLGASKVDQLTGVFFFFFFVVERIVHDHLLCIRPHAHTRTHGLRASNHTHADTLWFSLIRACL